MFFDCKVFDGKGNLKRIITAEEQKEKFRKECLALLPDKERKQIESYASYRPKGEIDEAGIYTLLY